MRTHISAYQIRAGGLIMFSIFFLLSSTTFKAQTYIPTPIDNIPPIAGTVEKDSMGIEMVYVPSASYDVGTDIATLENLCSTSSDIKNCVDEFSSTGILDKYRVKLPEFWIDRYEVTIEAYYACVNVGVCDEIDLFNDPKFSKPKQPQVKVTWFDAVRACNQRGARLPTEEEWEYAASGTNKTIFPWGNKIVEENFPLDDRTYEVGTLPKNVSWIGIYDMAGNAAEWVENLYLPYNRLTGNWSNFSETERVLRGGSWGSSVLESATMIRARTNTEEISTTNGFRCARYTDPSRS